MEGKIIKGIGGFYYVKTDEGIIECKARGKFRQNKLKPLVGDNVKIAIDKNKGVIDEIHIRHSELIRPAVANVTLAFVVFAMKSPDINFDLLYKFLILCESNNIKPIVCLNKMDLVSDKEKEEIKNKINDVGYEVVFINAREKIGIDVLKDKMKDNITVLCGPSGVGKSTLINALSDEYHMETGNISEKLKRGKHTTRHSELIEISNGYLVDTPGFSTLDISFIEKEDLKYAFPDFEEYNNLCKFRGCLHYKEPGCIVKEKVKEGIINNHRYDFYIKTIEDITSGRKYK